MYGAFPFGDSDKDLTTKYKSTQSFLLERMPKLLPAFTLLVLATVVFAAPAAADAQATTAAASTCDDISSVCQCLPPLDVNQIMDAFPDFLTACV